MLKSDYTSYGEKMDKSIAFLLEDFGTIRAGKANPGVLAKIMVDYYGVATPIGQVGNISVPEPRMLLIAPWDSSLIKDIEKALLKSDLGITPSNDGRTIRLTFPPLTEERRRDLVKLVHKKSEETKVAVRAIRRDAIEYFKKIQKTGEITEDELKDAEKDIQDLTDEKIKEIDKEQAKKEKEITEI
jgi:ribosome recycling factor